MARANAKKFCMEMEIPEISKLESIWSPEMLIHGIPWKIKVCTKIEKEVKYLAVFLFCVNEEKSPNWPLSGTATFKLLPFSEHVNPIEHHIATDVFDSPKNGYGSVLISWNALFNQNKKFVENDSINLEVKVAAENPNDPNRSRLDFECVHKCCDDCNLGEFRLTVKNISNLMAVQSPQFSLRGLPWLLQVSKMRSSRLGVLLRMKSDSETGSSKMTVAMKLLSSKKHVQPIEACVTKEYKFLTYLISPISWDEMVKPENGFVIDNSITLEVVIGTENSKAFKSNLPKTEAKSVRLECSICLECIDDQELAVTPCGHLFCLACVTKAVSNRAACPSCNKAVKSDDLRRLFLPV